MKRRLRLDGVFGFLIYTSVFAFPKVFFRHLDSAGADTAWRSLGIISIFLGQLVRISSRGYKAQHSHNGNRLLCAGPYELVRNPMFLGIFLVGLGMGVMFFKPWAIALFVAGFALRYAPVIMREEKKLKLSFPGEYIAYCARACRFLPALGRLLQMDIAAYLPVKPEWVRRESGAVGTVLFVVFSWGLRREFDSSGAMAFFHQGIFFLVAIIVFAGVIAYLIQRTNNYHAGPKAQSKDPL